MKNPKVGERVAWQVEHQKIFGVIDRLMKRDHVEVLVYENGFRNYFLIPMKDLRRLLPKKKRERTYTEAEINLAMADVLGPTNLNVWPKVRRVLREGAKP